MLSFKRVHLSYLDEWPMKNTLLPSEDRKELSSKSEICMLTRPCVLLGGIFPLYVGVRHTENDLISWMTWKGRLALLAWALWVNVLNDVSVTTV